MYNPAPPGKGKTQRNKKTKEETNDSFSFPFQCVALKLVGVWPLDLEETTLFNRCYILWSHFIIIIISLTCYVQISYLTYAWGDLFNSTECGCTVLMGLHNLIRLIHLSFKRKEMKTMIGNFVNHIWISKATNRKIAEDCEKRTILLKIVSVMQFTLICMYVILPLIELSTNSESYLLEKPFPYKMIFPYDASNNGNLVYIITYFITSLAGFCVVVTLFAEDSLFCYFLSYSCGQFKLLHHNLQIQATQELQPPPDEAGSIRPLGLNRMRKEQLLAIEHAKAVDNMKLMVDKHNMIISFCNDLERFFSPILLINFVISSFLICLVGFQIVVVRMSVFNFAKLLIYIISALSQLFILCLNGDKLIEDSSETATEVYNCNWNQKNFSNGRYRIVKDLMCVIVRAQIPVKITAFKFSTLSLHSFTKILSTSLSYFTLLRTLVDDSEIE